jgi:dihydropyrimidine dehydrogenase (NAD+) subunit PreA
MHYYLFKRREELTHMADLRTTLGGVSLKTPFHAASHATIANLTPREHAGQLARYVEKGAAAVSTAYTTITRERPADSKPRGRTIRAESAPPFGKEGFFLICSTYDIISYLDETLELIRHLKELVEVPIIGNIVGPGADGSGWAELSKTFEEAGASILELNVSCPVVDIPQGLEPWTDSLPKDAGVMLGQLPELTKEVTRAAVDAVDIPVLVKMTPEVGYPMLLTVAQNIQEGGANGITVINAPISVAPPDIYNHGKPRFKALDKYTFGGAYGPWDRFLAYKFITALAKNFPDLDISAVGGNVDPEHSVEFLMLGATTVQLSSAVLWRGPGIISKNIKFLERLMDEQEYENLDDLRGEALKYIVPLSEVDFGDAHAVIDPELCNGCGTCTRVLCRAMDIKDGLAVNNDEKCSGCGFCAMFCEEGAINIVRE